MAVLPGLERLRLANFSKMRGKRVGLVCNQATVDLQLRHALELFTEAHHRREIEFRTVFGPQHGLFGHTQDNMIEWEPGNRSNRWGVEILSLYGIKRSPAIETLRELDVLVVDLPDIGSRYYTFLWTLALCMGAAAEAGIQVLVLDRPNPIGGVRYEGPVLREEFASFVGLHPLPTRHGMTLGEVAAHLRGAYFQGCDLEIERVEGWNRADDLDQARVPWVMPSPNMPNLSTAFVYPGGCLLEGCNLSEGRGTTRPFEIFGAPFLDGWRLSEALNRENLPGCHFRPLQFQPTFQKHAGVICEGAFLHVLDRTTFEPVLTFVAALQEARRQAGSHLAWNPPPYEYETEKLPIDILAGNAWLRDSIDQLLPLKQIRDRMAAEAEGFAHRRSSALIY